MLKSDETVWNDDGHIIVLQLNQSELRVLETECPHPAGEGECWHYEVGCVVGWFVKRFGLDCHVGVAPPKDKMRVAWSWVGSAHDLDMAQVWIMSTDDEFYSAWSFSQMNPDTDS